MALKDINMDSLVSKMADRRADRNNNQNVMAAIKRMHSFVENVDIDKQRHTQDSFGILFGANKELEFEQIKIGHMNAEWTRLRHSHRKQPVILYCHGGGYATGSTKYARTVTSKFVEATSMSALAFDYRLAPEHPYPAAIDDAVKVWDYLMYYGYGAEDIIVVGDSAGGNLALELLMRIKAKKRMMPKALVLLSPWTDLTCAGETQESRASIDPVLDHDYLQLAIEYYTAGKMELDDPLVSPLYADFTGFPPTYIQVGDNEILLDDSRMLYKKLLEYNVLTRISIYEGMWHVFQMAPFKKSFDAVKEAAEFIYEICK
ncbi:MAG: alpha/beta hydrolase [bacterium]|nr:alpha/beta hydrolase [bacterium]